MAILYARFIYILDIWKMRFHNVLWQIQGHTDINWSGPSLSDSCKSYILPRITLSLFCFAKADSGMNALCLALLDAIGYSHYVFKFPRETTIVGIKKKIPFQLHIFMNVSMNTLRMYLSISNVVFSRNLEKNCRIILWNIAAIIF